MLSRMIRMQTSLQVDWDVKWLLYRLLTWAFRLEAAGKPKPCGIRYWNGFNKGWLDGKGSTYRKGEN